jgi:hypothetical protein
MHEEECVIVATLLLYPNILDSMDLDLPLEVDDEFWEHQDPKLAFKQPRGLPSKVTSFVQMIKLNQILSIAHRTIVSCL